MVTPFMTHIQRSDKGRAGVFCCFPRKAKGQSMERARTYSIHDLKTGQIVAHLGADGTLSDKGDPQAIAQLKELLQRELLVRERQFTFEAEDEDEGYELFPEGSMCYFGMITLRPSDPEYLTAFLSCLPSISTYEARAVRE
jgi:hypothetical protein